MYDRIAKQKLNVFLIVDSSTSMRGERIRQVNDAIEDIVAYLIELQDENVNVDFYLSILSFSTSAQWKDNLREVKVKEMRCSNIRAGGQSNLHLAYLELGKALQKFSKGGIMPDYGGIAPIILLLTDGHPTKSSASQLRELKYLPWFNVALRYGIAIELNDDRTRKVLGDFVGSNGEVIDCYDSRILQRIIKVIVLTASKVKSRSSACRGSEHSVNNSMASSLSVVKQQIQEALADAEDWEW